MTNAAIFILIIILALAGFTVARERAIRSATAAGRALHSLPRHYGYLTATAGFLPGLMVLVAWLLFGEGVIEKLVIQSLNAATRGELAETRDLLINRLQVAVRYGEKLESDPVILNAAERYRALYTQGIWGTFLLAVGSGIAGTLLTLRRINPDFRARNRFESVLMWVLILSSGIAILTTVGIVASLLYESVRFFQDVPIHDFLFGLKWSPQTALRADQVGSSGAFGAVPLFAGTFLISLIAMLIAGPIGLMGAIYLTQYASARMRNIAKPLLEILAGVPTVVYGFFAAITVAPFFRESGDFFGLPIASESALAAGVVMGIMIIPFVSSLSDDALTAVPRPLRDGSYALGATKSETIIKVLLPAALPGIVGAFLLAISRAVGETMIVVMAAGMRPNLTANPFEAVTTVTVQIVALLTGDQEFDSAKTLSAFALGLALFVITLGLNMLALRIVRKHREIYE
ncbi:phosphate ABC transporter permease subunit PstC [Yunchengibacter salinarum]|uniref:phosphate ABC transporter permease subunit PstC n=1 Tax=Yunchengibacter salinarum TaxID=3133399 RepID=UPI0035B6936C